MEIIAEGTYAIYFTPFLRVIFRLLFFRPGASGARLIPCGPPALRRSMSMCRMPARSSLASKFTSDVNGTISAIRFYRDPITPAKYRESVVVQLDQTGNSTSVKEMHAGRRSYSTPISLRGQDLCGSSTHQSLRDISITSPSAYSNGILHAPIGRPVSTAMAHQRPFPRCLKTAITGSIIVFTQALPRP